MSAPAGQRSPAGRAGPAPGPTRLSPLGIKPAHRAAAAARSGHHQASAICGPALLRALHPAPALLAPPPPRSVILDEAQLVANSSSVAAVMASSLWRRHAWVVTGTPISSKLDEIKGGCPWVQRYRGTHALARAG